MRSLWRLLLAAAGTLSFRQHLPVPCASLALQPSAVWHVMAGQRGRVHFLASAYSSIKPFDAPMIPMMSCERDRNEHLPCSSIWPFSSLNRLVLATGQVNTSAMQPKTGWAAPFVFCFLASPSLKRQPEGLTNMQAMFPDFGPLCRPEDCCPGPFEAVLSIEHPKWEK